MTDVAIRIRDLSKCYPIYGAPRDRLTQFIAPRLQRMVGLAPKNYYREFWALKDISFEVQKGEPVGIIGRNGAGKSTLLQLICGTLTPTTGSVEARGRIAALLELGSGFNPEFTGRENVYLNASVLGLSNAEIDARFDDIAAFADIGDFLEQPVKTYSSGMLMRLAFAVSTCVDPEILIVDEALGVGDAPFQSKCFKRLRQLISSGVSLLFVSHDISTVRSICSRALWLSNGRMEAWGAAVEVAREYEKFCWREQGVIMQALPGVAEEVPAKSTMVHAAGDAGSSVPSALFQPNPAFEGNRLRTKTGTGAIAIRNFLLVNDEGLPVKSCKYNERLTAFYLLELQGVVDSDFVLALRIRDVRGTFIYAVNDLTRIQRMRGAAGDSFTAVMTFNVPLHHQDYVISTAIFGFKTGSAFVDGVYDFSGAVIWESIDDAAFISVDRYDLMPLPGPVHVTSDLRLQEVSR